MIEDNIMTKKKFASLVEDMVHKKRMTYFDSILEICDERGIEPEDISKLISPAIKDKLEAECISANMIKGGNTLPL